MLFDYDKSSATSILEYAKKLEGLTFSDVKNLYLSHFGLEDTANNDDSAGKGQLGNFLEEYYFGYEPNGEQDADFKEAGVELKLTCIDVRKDGSYTAGERLSITNISYEEPVEHDFYKSHVWRKISLILLIHYIRDKKLQRMMYKIMFANLFTPPENDLKIIIDDYNKIIGKIEAGLAHEISESDTLYLGACTKGSTALKSTRPQYYGDHTPARKRNFCFKRQYMDYVLNNYVLKDDVPCERIIKDSSELHTQTFEDIIISRISKYIGMSDRLLCEMFGREYNNNKAQWIDLAYRMLGISGNKAEEFIKANVVVKSIRLEENGTMKESLSFPPFKFVDLVTQTWEESDIYHYFSETKFLFVIYKRNGKEYHLHSAKFWNMPQLDLENKVKEGWENTQNIIKTGVKFVVNKNGSVSNNLPKKNDNEVIHVRPHAQKAAYKLHNGLTIGNVNRDANPLPDGQWMTTQSFWINNSYILKQLGLIG